MKNEQLVFASQSLSLPSGIATFTERDLSFSDKATDAEVLAVGARLMSCKGYLKWAIGSLFAEMLKRRPAKVGSTTDFDMGWVSEFADAHHIDPKERRELLGVYLFYVGCDSTPGALTFEHHREAMWGTADGQPGQLDRALSYLARAAEQGLSVTQLRMLIRAEARTTEAEPKQLELAAYSVVFDFMRFTKNAVAEVAHYSPERCRLIKNDIGEDAKTYIDTIWARAAIEDMAVPRPIA